MCSIQVCTWHLLCSFKRYILFPLYLIIAVCHAVRRLFLKLYIHVSGITVLIIFEELPTSIGVLVSSGVDHELPSFQTKDYTIDICCFFVKHAALRSKSKDWLAQNQDNQNQDNAIEWSDISTH